MKKSLSLIVCFLVVSVAALFLTACGRNNNGGDNGPVIFSAVGEWHGTRQQSTTTFVTTQEWETNEGVFLGRLVANSGRTVYIAGGKIRDLLYTSDGLIERDTGLFLGDDYTYIFTLTSWLFPDVVFDGSDIALVDGLYYYLISTNEQLGRTHNFTKTIHEFTINDQTFLPSEVYQLEPSWAGWPPTRDHWFSGDNGWAFIDVETNLAFRTSEVIRNMTAFEFEEHDDVFVTTSDVNIPQVPNPPIAPKVYARTITRVLDGVIQTNVKLEVGDNFAVLRVSIATTFDYSPVEGLTFTKVDTLVVRYYRGHFGQLNNRIYLTVSQQSTNGTSWFNSVTPNPQFEIDIVDNALVHTGIPLSRQGG